jgi:polysaccharide export outer membrane protein
MRQTRIALPMLMALMAAACSRHQPISYAIDPATGQAVPVVQRYQPQAQPQYAQPSHAQPQYAQRAYASTTVAQAAATQRHRSEGRGLFTRQNASATTPRAHVQQPYVLQYHPPQPAAGTAYAAAPPSYAYAPAAQPAYTLDSGDKLRVVVFGQEGITGIYTVDAGGQVNLPLIGAVAARGSTTHALSQRIAERLKQGYVREPHVTVEIAAYRPFFILGEVTTPGQYPYVPNMTAEKAVAIAGGFAPRADKNEVELTRNADGQRYHGDVPLTYPLKPGDTIVVKERWF